MWRIFGNTFAKHKKRTHNGRPPRIRLAVEPLEDRTVPTTFFADPSIVDGKPGSLRDAILQANADLGSATDTIILQPGTYALGIPNTKGQGQDLNTAERKQTYVDAQKRVMEIVPFVGVMSQIRVEAMATRVHDFRPGPDGLTGTAMNDAWVEG